jgi:hypothetical protein
MNKVKVKQKAPLPVKEGGLSFYRLVLIRMRHERKRWLGWGQQMLQEQQQPVDRLRQQ